MSSKDANIVVFSRKSDLTLVSSDGVHFRVHSVMLSEASEVFETMLTIPQPRASTVDSEPPLVALSEDAETLTLLLSWIYPLRNRTSIHSFDQLARLFGVAQKYDVTMDTLCSMLTCPCILSPNPFLVYLMCVKHGAVEQGRIAAREIVLRNIDPFKVPITPQIQEGLRHASALSIRRLDDFRMSTRQEAVDCLKKALGFSLDGRPGSCSKCWEARKRGYHCSPRPILELIEDVFTVPSAESVKQCMLRRDPSIAPALDLDHLADHMVSRWSRCIDGPLGILNECVKTFKWE